MKKTYQAPKAEKMDFEYSEAVVASGEACRNVTKYTEWNPEQNCKQSTISYEVQDV